MLSLFCLVCVHCHRSCCHPSPFPSTRQALALVCMPRRSTNSSQSPSSVRRLLSLQHLQSQLEARLCPPSRPRSGVTALATYAVTRQRHLEIRACPHIRDRQPRQEVPCSSNSSFRILESFNVVAENLSSAARAKYVADSRLKADELCVWKWYSVLFLLVLHRVTFAAA
jgi:hypothetical protein